MENKEFQNLMDSLRGLIKINLEDRADNAIICPICNGLGLYEGINDDSRCLVKCKCNNGIMYKCKHCGELSQYNSCNCEGVRKERRLKEEELERKNKEEAIIKNGVIDIRKYENMVVYNDDVYDKDDLEYYVREHILNGYDIDRYVYGTDKEENYITCDLRDYFEEKFDGNGYEDMAEYFNFDDPLFKKAQDNIDSWLENHKSLNTIYFQNRNIIVDIQPMIDKVKMELENK